MSDSVRPHRRQPTRLPCPWDSPGKNTGVGCHFLLQCMKVVVQMHKLKSLSRVQLLATPGTVAYQAPLSMGFSRQEYWSGLPFPSPLNGHEFEQTPGDGEGQGSLAFNLSLIWSPAAFKLVYVLFAGPHHSLSLPLLSGTTICSKFILHFP